MGGFKGEGRERGQKGGDVTFSSGVQTCLVLLYMFRPTVGPEHI